MSGTVPWGAMLLGHATIIAVSSGCSLRRAPEAPPAPTPGKVVMLPGIINFTSHLAGFAAMVRQAHPEWEIDLRRWGPPFLSLHNLRDYERNRRTAAARAAELAEYRREHPEALIHLVGYSGGGALALFVVEALPEDVMIDRLILLAPAISPDYALAEKIMPHVRGFVVNYASRLDLQVSWGTRVFGTLDREKTCSAGHCGFVREHPKLLQVYWDERMRRDGHYGNHLSYVSPAWQRKHVLPALDATLTIERLRAVLEQRLSGEDAPAR